MNPKYKMNLLSKNCPSFLTAVCLLAVVLTSQASEEIFRANLRFFNPITDTRDLFFMSKGEDREIRCTFSGPSGRYHYEGPTGRLQLYRMSGTGESAQRMPVASLTLPATGEDYLVFMLPDRNLGTEGFLTRVFNDNIQLLSKGNTRIYNLLPNTIAVKYGEQEMIIEKGSSKTVNNREAMARDSKESSDTDYQHLDMPVHVVVRNTEGWKVVYRSVWYPIIEARHQVFVIPENKGAVRVVQITD